MDAAGARDAVLAETEPGYSPLRHGIAIALLGGGAIAAAAWGLEGLRAADLGVAAGAFLFANVAEWALHRYVLHVPTLLRIVYERHALKHHVAFTHERMAIGGARELRWILMPWHALPAMLLGASPVAAALYLLAGERAARVFLAVAVGYYLLYEALHAAYHLPETSRLGRSRIVAALRRHHAAHHDPRAMTSVNFNITFPIADALFGTMRREAK